MEEPMEKAKIEKYKKVLLTLKTQILSGGVLKIASDLHTSPEDLSEEGDLANNVIHQEISFNIKNRELKKLREIEEALDRIESNCFGECDDCGEEISEKRLNTQPWTTLCIHHAEERERENLVKKLAW